MDVPITPDLVRTISDMLGVPDVSPWLSTAQQYWWVGPTGLLALGGSVLGMQWLRGSQTSRYDQAHGYGSAHFASSRELRRAGLYRSTGLYVGRAYGRDLRGPRSHVVVIGPSECGKTRSVGMAELEWPGSALVFDIKRQHYLLGADICRQRGKQVHCFEPRVRGSARLNPLDAVPFGEEEEIQAIQRVSDHVTDPGMVTSASQGALFYRGRTRGILEAAMLYVGNYQPPASFAKVRALMRDLPAILAAMRVTDHPIISSIAADLLGERLETRRSLWNGAMEYLRVFDDPILAYNTDATTVDLRTLQHGERPQVVYVCMTPDDAQGPLRLVPRLLLDQHIAHASERRDVTQFRWHELINLDDQYLLGYLAAADHTTAFYREHGLWLMSVFQSFSQLSAYGSYAGLLDNSKTWVVFRPNHTASAKIISEKLGTTTVMDTHEARSPRGRTRTTVLHARDLMTPFEVEHIPDYHAFVFVSGVAPLLAQQVPFTERILV